MQLGNPWKCPKRGGLLIHTHAHVEYIGNAMAIKRDTGYLPTNVKPEHMNEIKNVLVISWAPAGSWQVICDTFQGGDNEEYVKTDTKGSFALKVRGESMELEFRDIDIKVINPYLKQEHNKVPLNLLSSDATCTRPTDVRGCER